VLYERARNALATQLLDYSASEVAAEKRALEQAISKVEAEANGNLAAAAQEPERSRTRAAPPPAPPVDTSHARTSSQDRDSVPPIQSESKVAVFARRACESHASQNFKAGDLADLIIAIRKELRRVFPDISPGDVDSFSTDLLSVKCPVCGELSESAKSMLVIGSTGMFGGARVIFGGPNVATLAGGQCPKCGGTNFNASFSVESIKRRSRGDAR
jgi:hypothetical protein